MPVKEMASAAPITARKRFQPDAPELMETPLHRAESGNGNGNGNGSATAEETGKRRMPETLQKFLLRVQGGKLYLPAAYRIVWFRDECPDWGIATTLVEGGFEAGFATVKAEIYNPEGRLIASDYKTESKQDFPAGWVEKAATGAIARALALSGFGTQFAPELDEQVFADSPQRMGSGFRSRSTSSHYSGGNGNTNGATSKVREGAMPAMASDVWEGPDQCPTCHAPAGKRHGKQCIDV